VGNKEMGDAQKFTVVMSGEIGPGHNIDEAKAEFAELFKTTVEKSEPYFQGKRRVLRKDLGEKQAKAYEDALTAIGIISDLLPQQAEEAVPKTSVELSVADMRPSKPAEPIPAEPDPDEPDPDEPEPAEPIVTKEESPTPVELAIVDIEPKQVPELSIIGVAPKKPMAEMQMVEIAKCKTTSSMICPKCRTQQEQADACAECGVIVEKYKQLASTLSDHRSAAQDDLDYPVESDETGAKKFNILAAVGVALIVIVSVAVVLL
jgi:hypothetical protein